MTHPSKNNKPDLIHEFRLRDAGVHQIAGLDEVGRGAWAGPIIAAAVILPLDQFDLSSRLEGIRDSKLMTPKQRRLGAEKIWKIAISVGIGRAEASQVDEMGIIQATRSAMRKAIDSLGPSPQHLLIDHIPLPQVKIQQTVITKGDLKVLSIAAASVIAKVTRDELMVALEKEYPGYGFSRHKGYGTREHQLALAELGPSSIHRYSFQPVAERNFFQAVP
jgi:ribonuclease HII